MRPRSKSLIMATACIASLLCGAVSVEGSQPVVAVSLQLDDPSGELPLAAAPTVAARAVASICKQAARRLGFLRWAAGPDGEPAAQWVVRLEVRTVELTDGAGHRWIGSEVRLRHRGSTGGAAWDLAVPEADEVLYPAPEPKPGNAEALAARIERHLERQLPGLLGTPEVADFVSHIPLGDRVVADIAKKQFLVLIDRRALQAQTDSELEIRMPTEQQPDLVLVVQPKSEVFEVGDFNGCVKGWIADCNSQSLAIRVWWDDNLPPLLDSALQVRVFMRSYKPGSGWASSVSSGLVDGPLPTTGTRCAAAEVRP